MSNIEFVPFWLPDPEEAPFKVIISKDQWGGAALEVRSTVVGGRYTISREYMEGVHDSERAVADVVDELTEQAKWRIIERYGLLGELERRARIGSNFRESPYYRR